MKWHGTEDYDQEAGLAYLEELVRTTRQFCCEAGGRLAYNVSRSPEEREEMARAIAQTLHLPQVLYPLAVASYDYGYSRVRLAQLARTYCEQRFPRATILSSNEETRYDAEADQWSFVFYRDYYAALDIPNSSGESDPRAHLMYGWQPPTGWQLLATDCDPTPTWARDEREGEYGDPSRHD